jgi:putative ABC transport system substrate-binding protein
MWRTPIRIITTLALCVLAVPCAVEAQPPGRVRTIGVLGGSLDQSFWQAMRELGWVESQHLVVERRDAAGHYERLPDLAAELVRLNVDVIVTVTTPGALAAKHATSRIPIVFTLVADPIGAGVIPSLARPGGNITGVTTIAADLDQKRLELLKEVVPGLSRVGVLWNAANPANAAAWQETQAAAGALGLQLDSQDVRGPQDLEGAFTRTAQVRPEALLVLLDGVLGMHRPHIAGFATQQQLPSMFAHREWVVAGGLMSYGASFADHFLRAATYVDKILKGATPADLPVEQPMKFELVINLKTAQALGITIPPIVLFRADEVIR